MSLFKKFDTNVWSWVFATERRTAKVALSMLFVMCMMMTAIGGYFAVVTNDQNKLLAHQTIAAQTASQQIVREIDRGLQVHGTASASRSCNSIKLLSFLIRVGNRRAHKLNTGSYITDAQFDRINAYVKGACTFAPVIEGGTG